MQPTDEPAGGYLGSDELYAVVGVIRSRDVIDCQQNASDRLVHGYKKRGAA